MLKTVTEIARSIQTLIDFEKNCDIGDYNTNIILYDG
jgi:hypothetical protein